METQAYKKQFRNWLTQPPPGLIDMLIAYNEPAEPGEWPGLITQRQLMKECPNEFMERMVQLEKSWGAQEKAAWGALKAVAKMKFRESTCRPVGP
jgi:hypothetical protein